jgi:hypothetical protein
MVTAWFLERRERVKMQGGETLPTHQLLEIKRPLVHYWVHPRTTDNETDDLGRHKNSTIGTEINGERQGPEHALVTAKYNS